MCKKMKKITINFLKRIVFVFYVFDICIKKTIYCTCISPEKKSKCTLFIYFKETFYIGILDAEFNKF